MSVYGSPSKVCVVGGGPAGLAAAIALRQIGCAVTLVDCAIPPIDKACGEGLLPDSIEAMRELGIEIPNSEGFAFHGIRFTDTRASVSATFPNGAARGMRRTVLQQLLIAHANRLGVAMIWNAKHVRLTASGVYLDSELLQADLVVGADGQNSQIRRQAMLNQVKRQKLRYAFRRHYRATPWAPYMELHWGSRSQIYLTPISSEEICVASISCDPQFRLDHALAEIPNAKQRLGTAVATSQEIGALSVSRALKSVCRDNVVLIGDASGSVDAITGQGMGLAFKQALALADCVVCNDIRKYQILHRALMQRPQNMASLMLALDSNGQLQRRALAGLAQYPELFQTLVAIHVGASSCRDLWSTRLLDFGRAFLAA